MLAGIVQKAMFEDTTCIICGPAPRKGLFIKNSADGTPFQLNKCLECGLQFIAPRPVESAMRAYYGARYFTTRTERGYDNYFSPEVRREIERVFELNLKDLGFYRFEEGLAGPRRSLDIGCAAGYFVNYLKGRGWDAGGIDISGDCVQFAVRTLGLSVSRGNYLESACTGKFNLITLWATIEHLHRPDLVLEKISNDLAGNGRLYLSTCRIGGLNYMKLFGRRWRYYNFPEHLFFFSYSAMKRLLHRTGFRLISYKTYGSGLGRAGSPLKTCADYTAKKLHMGDMMLIAAEKLPT